jgi:hypothetical protein
VQSTALVHLAGAARANRGGVRTTGLVGSGEQGRAARTACGSEVRPVIVDARAAGCGLLRQLAAYLNARRSPRLWAGLVGGTCSRVLARAG